MVGRAEASDGEGPKADGWAQAQKPLSQEGVLHSNSPPNYSIGKGSSQRGRHGLGSCGGGRGGAAVGKSTWMPSVLPE